MEVRVAHLVLATLLGIIGSGSGNVLSNSFFHLCNSTIIFDRDVEGAAIDLSNMIYPRIDCFLTVVSTLETGVMIRLVVEESIEQNNCRDSLQLPNQTVPLCHPYPKAVTVTTTPFTIKLSTTGYRTIPLSLLFSVYTEATNIACPPSYAKCLQNMCVPQRVYCYQDKDFCNAGSRCQDMPSTGSGVSVWNVVFPVVSCTVLVFILYYFCCVRFLNFHEKVKSKCCPSRARPRGPLRAVDVYVVRTSEDDDGTDAGPVDSRMFDPPPDYNSLEQIHTGHGQAYDNKVDVSDELPPDYQAVMLNMAEYKVAMYI